MKNIFSIFVIFLFLFSFRLPLFYNSAFLSIFLIFIGCLFIVRKEQSFFLHNCKKILLDRSTLLLIFSIIIICIVSLVYPLLTETYDFTILSTLLNQFISIFLALILVSYFNIDKTHSVIEFIIFAFVIQSLIQLTAFLYTPFFEFVKLFQSETAIEIGETYGGGGMRAVAISGSQFFGLSASYGFVFLLFFNYLVTKRRTSITDLVIFSLLVVGTIFSGRTGFVGLAAALCYSFVVSQRRLLVLGFISKLTLFSFVVVNLLVAFVLDPERVLYIKNVLFPWAFEFIYSVIRTGSIETRSSSGLINHYFWLDDIDYIIGMGLNKVYLSDAGYMRNLIYGGVSWLFLLSIYQIQLFIALIRKDKSRKLFFIVLCMFIFVLHYKGEAVGFLLMIQKMIFMILFSTILYNKRDYHEKNSDLYRDNLVKS
ncbi:hypothetical protein AB4169_09285 [Vibrio lentus]